MTDEEIDRYANEIAEMSHTQMARLWRFAPPGSPYFKRPVFAIFEKRFKDLGGMTPEISKDIGL